jgi:hypothetical protein
VNRNYKECDGLKGGCERSKNEVVVRKRRKLNDMWKTASPRLGKTSAFALSPAPPKTILSLRSFLLA